MDLSFIKSHKWLVAVFGATAGGYVLYSYLHRGSSGTASPVVGGNAVQSGSPQYLVPVVQSIGPGMVPVSTATSPSTNTPVPATSTQTNPTSIAQPQTKAAAVVASNPYTVGTRVTSNETITQSVYDPLYNGWVNLTSKGGIYTSPGFSVTGSGINPAWNGSGRLQLLQNGAQVKEYNPAGQAVGTFSLK